ncbi:MAG: hypothetical protein ACTH8F_13325 [Microbacterium sp.]|uniref:hypothetical protein n=1 Tax=Microbacterium sp. TaxID=51671 RepID=UPI003F96ECEB
MNRSSTTARIITALIGLIVTPIAVGMISGGGVTVYKIFSMHGSRPDFELMIMPMLTGLVGMILLAAVVATGRWSSAGLLVAGLFGIVTLVMAIAPGLLLEFFRIVPDFVPREWTEGLMYGLPVITYTVLGAMGLTLLVIRRRPARSTTGLAIAGFVAAPVLLALGGWLMISGSQEGQLQAVRTFSTMPNLIASLAVLGGAVLTIIGIGGILWSRMALILPAAALLVMSAFMVLSMATPGMMGFLPSRVWMMWLPHFLMGGAVAVAVAQLTFTVVIARLARSTVGFVPPAAVAWVTPDARQPQDGPFPDASPYAGGQLNQGLNRGHAKEDT